MRRILPFLPVVLLIVLFVYLLGRSTALDVQSEIPIERECPSAGAPGILTFMSKAEFGRVLETFPYAWYLETRPFCDTKVLRRDLADLDSAFHHDVSLGRNLFITALTEQLEIRIRSALERYHADTLIRLAQWVDKFDAYRQLDDVQSRQYKIIYRHWMNVIANRLGQYYEADPAVKHDFKFRYLSAWCQSKNYAPPLGFTKTEKVLHHLMDQNWSYLFNRFWHGSGAGFKVVALLTLLLTLYGYWCIVRVHWLGRGR